MELRTARLFLSSTFRDFGEERDLLVKRVFPALRARLKDRFVELVDVDLRWGITAEEAERGEVLPICLAEIDRARPYFIGMLGERYGWIPPAGSYAVDLLERQPWLKKHQGGKSVTELEILHGVLNDRRMRGRAFFYFRSPAYARTKGGDYIASTEDRARQHALKRRIRERGLPVTTYGTPEALAKRIEHDLWRLLDAEFPASSVPDAFERERLRHQAYAAPRRRLYLCSERQRQALDQALKAGAQRILITGASGGGKSALLANFFEAYRKRHPRQMVHEHYLNANSDAGDPHALVRRLIEFIQRVTGSTQAIPGDLQTLMDSFPTWLATASAWARKRRTRFIFVIDALNGLTNQQDLRWWPAFLPPRISVVASCLAGPVLDTLVGRTEAVPGQRKRPTWKTIMVRPLTRAQSAHLLKTYLAKFNKTLPASMVRQVQAHTLATNPLFVRTLAEELRLFGVHEELQQRLDRYLASSTIDGLFERVLERTEKDCGRTRVETAMTAIWASRAGLTEKEILGIANLTPAIWAAIRHAMNDALADTAGGKITFLHEHIRFAVRNRYLARAGSTSTAHAIVGNWFRKGPSDERRAFEEPWQWRRARKRELLKRALTDREMFLALSTYRDHEEVLSHWASFSNGNTRDTIGASYEKAWKAWQRESKNLNFDIEELANALCGFLHFAGCHGELAPRIATWTLKRKVKRKGVHREDLAEALITQGVALQDAGKMRLAENAFRGAMEHLTPAKHALPEIWKRTINHLAHCLHKGGNISVAEDMYSEVARLCEIAGGPNHPDTANAINNLGVLHYDTERHESAIQFHRRALGIHSRCFGNNSIETAHSMTNLGISLAALGRVDEAMDSLYAALNTYKSILGESHPFTAKAMNNLVMCLRDVIGDKEPVGSLLEDLLRITERANGKEHLDTAIATNNLAAFFEGTGDLASAETLYGQATDVLNRVAGPEHFSARTATENLCRAREKLGKTMIE